ncbi:hypothetical protein M0812_17423 [Anaeramoeba flamelloides]|uniref:CUE domain-containing protein n=1 Tax=Anaeramoeba flamelloides TaxID=1746091 RepID=A0AAV7ZCY3_9EUKA|nr:hypothetical protein M0812_17423 [Anaeramoeba flamelloides]
MNKNSTTTTQRQKKEELQKQIFSICEMLPQHHPRIVELIFKNNNYKVTSTVEDLINLPTDLNYYQVKRQLPSQRLYYGPMYNNSYKNFGTYRYRDCSSYQRYLLERSKCRSKIKNAYLVNNTEDLEKQQNDLEQINSLTNEKISTYSSDEEDKLLKNNENVNSSEEEEEDEVEKEKTKNEKGNEIKLNSSNDQFSENEIQTISSEKQDFQTQIDQDKEYAQQLANEEFYNQLEKYQNYQKYLGQYKNEVSPEKKPKTENGWWKNFVQKFKSKPKKTSSPKKNTNKIKNTKKKKSSSKHKKTKNNNFISSNVKYSKLPLDDEMEDQELFTASDVMEKEQQKLQIRTTVRKRKTQKQLDSEISDSDYVEDKLLANEDIFDDEPFSDNESDAVEMVVIEN